MGGRISQPVGVAARGNWGNSHHRRIFFFFSPLFFFFFCGPGFPKTAKDRKGPVASALRGRPVIGTGPFGRERHYRTNRGNIRAEGGVRRPKFPPPATIFRLEGTSGPGNLVRLRILPGQLPANRAARRDSFHSACAGRRIGVLPTAVRAENRALPWAGERARGAGPSFAPIRLRPARMIAASCDVPYQAANREGL